MTGLGIGGMRLRATGWLLVAGLLTAASGPASAQATGAAAPDFTRTTLAGKDFMLSRYRGHTVLLSFWATWCEPCLGELAVFGEWQHRYGPQGLKVVGIAMDDDASAVRGTVSRLHVAYPVLVGDAELGTLYGGIYGLPLNIVVDPAGRIVARLTGEGKLPALEQAVRGELKRAVTHGR